MTLRLVDGSRYQGAPDFAAARASGLDGVVWNVDDPAFVTRIQDAHSAGLLVAAYHFTATGNGDATVAAAHALNVCAPVLDLLSFIAGDHESGTGDLTDWVLAYQRTLAAQIGARAWVYSGGWWLSQHIRHDATDLAIYRLWDASYTSTPPTAPPPWQKVSLWQYTDKATVPGFGGPVDESVTDLDIRAQATNPAPVTGAAFPEDDDVQARLLYRGVVQIMHRIALGRAATQAEMDWWEAHAQQLGAGGYEWAIEEMMAGDNVVGSGFSAAIAKLHGVATS